MHVIMDVNFHEEEMYFSSTSLHRGKPSEEGKILPLDVHELFSSHTMVITDAVADGGNMHATTSEHVDGEKECESGNVQVSSEGEAKSIGNVDSGINEEEPQAGDLSCELEHLPGDVSSSGHHMTDTLSHVPSSPVLPSAHNQSLIGLDVTAPPPRLPPRENRGRRLNKTFALKTFEAAVNS
ncbi:hypothetical protein Droror1_Dr00027452 [Drosera rotundifolia]